MTPTIGTHDYSGACAPVSPTRYTHRTFSVGVFEWLQSSTKRPKRSAAKVRVVGLTSDPESVYARARAIVAELDDGKYTGPKRVVVKPDVQEEESA